MMEIKNIEELIPSLLIDGKKFLWYEHQNLLAPGENYGSIMVQVKIVLVNTKGKKEIIPCVAKLVPPSPFIWKMFNIPVTFKKEIRFYDTVVPTLNNFCKEHNLENLEFFPEYIGSRISLDPKTNDVDHDAVLLLKNLKNDGFGNCDRFIGFDRPTTMLIIKNLANFHATCVAYKLSKPEDFHKKVMPCLNKGVEPDFNPDLLKTAFDGIAASLSTNKDTAPLIERVMSKVANMADVFNSKGNEPFATAVHQDLWTNNMMAKFDGDGKPMAMKFVDFQIVEFGNPARDLLFLLYSSVELEELVNVDEYIRVYHDKFVEVLKNFSCDIAKFGLEEFKKEVDSAASVTEFMHVLFMLSPIFTKKEHAMEPKDMKDETAFMKNENVLHDNYHPRLHFIVKDFADRKWI